MEDLKPALGKFTWKVENFSKLTDKRHCSDIFVVDGCKWQIMIYPRGTVDGYFSMYVKVADPDALTVGWTREVDFILTMINQTCGVHSSKNGGHCNFNQKTPCLGFSTFKHLSELFDPSKGYLVNDTLVVKADLIVHKATPAVEFPVSLPECIPSHTTIQGNEIDSYLTSLENFISSSSCTSTGDVRSDCIDPTLEEVEKAKSSLKDCLSGFFQLGMKEKFVAALATLSCARSGLSSEQDRSIKTFWANFDEFFSDYLTCEEDEFRFELHRLGRERTFYAIKKNHDTHILYKKLMEDFVKVEEELEQKLQEVKSKKRKLMSDWKVLMTESEEAKVRYTAHEKKREEAKERRRRAEERRARLTVVWSDLKAHFT